MRGPCQASSIGLVSHVKHAVLVPFLLATVALALSGPGSAYSTACLSPQVAAGSMVVTDLRVASTLAILQPTGSCAGGYELQHAGTDCPVQVDPSDVATVNGAYCGQAAGAGASVICHWTGVVSKPAWVRLFVGFDGGVVNGEINTADGEYAYGPMDQGAYYVLVNPFPHPARVIAFPTDTDPVAPSSSSTDASVIGCGPFP